MEVLKWLAVGIVSLVLLAVLAGRLGLLQGKAPAKLGVREGRLKAPAKTPNSVSSQALLYPDHPMRERAQIAPLPLNGAPRPAEADRAPGGSNKVAEPHLLGGDGPATLVKLKSIVQSTTGAQVVQSAPDYLYAQFTTPLMRFVDDVEFWFDPAAGVVQVRSASRVGHSDRGLNRARVEAIRARLAEAP